MDAVVGADDTPYRKPNKEFSEYVLQKLGANPATTALIGDSPYDIQAAHAVGIPAYCVATGTHSIEELEEAKVDAAFPDLPALAKSIFGLNLLPELA